MSMHRWLISAGAVVALASCGSATDTTTFQPPPGYTAAVSVGPFVKVWRGPQNKRIGIVFMALPTEIPFDKIGENTTVQDAEVVKHEALKICGSQNAYYLSMIGATQEAQSADPGEKELIDVIATHLNGKTYMAMYVRPKGTAADPAAETAIKNVCPKS
ncbi:MAG TPA: hypothetical protein VMB20_11285 [Candidatus Acidoferrum sp.]|nr:hypothetical protein [Candidatus Acidoferrum sp.]